MLTKYTTTLTGDLEPNDSGEVYLASEVDARINKLTTEHAWAVDHARKMEMRIAELENEVRELILANTTLKAELDHYTDEG